MNRLPPKRPEPPLTADGKLPVQYPHRKGWHTDQSYRRPPPDISLFFAVAPVARDQDQAWRAEGRLAVRDDLVLGRLVTVLVDGPPLRRPLTAIRKPRRHGSDEAERLLGVARGEAAQDRSADR